jgi:cell division protein FtsL
MTTTDLKIAFINVITLGFNFMQIDLLLKIVLTAVAIGYTAHKWYLMYKNKK